MKKHWFTTLLICTVSFAYGQSGYKATAYNMVLKGTSNLHAWESKVNEIRTNATLTFSGGALKSISALTVEIPVKTIKSAKGKTMDNKTYEALNADAYPNIQYKLDRISGLTQQSTGYDINAVGNLTIAGTTKKVEMYVKGKMSPDGAITFSGTTKLKMTDFNVKPPTALMGTLTTGNEVEVVYQVTLKPN